MQQSNFHDYRMLRIDETPPIEVHLITSGEAPGGIGETGTTAAPPAHLQRDLRRDRHPAAPLADRPRRSRRAETGMSAVSRRRSRVWRYAAVGVVAVVAVVLIGFVMIVLGPGPTDFAGGKRVALADYHGADPTGVPRRARRCRPRRSAANI